jgi:hypothetical protein
MGKTWKKRDGHGKHVSNNRTKFHNEFNEDDEYSKNTHENSKNNHRSMKKAKDVRREFEDKLNYGYSSFPFPNIEN